MLATQTTPGVPGPRQLLPFQGLLAFRRDPLAFLSRMANRYGDVVRLGGWRWRTFLLNHPDDIHAVLVRDAESFQKGPALRHAKITLGEGLLTSEGEIHRRQRRLSQPAFHPQQVATYAPIMVKYASRMRDTWHKGQELDLHEQMMKLALWIVAEALFGAEIQAQVERISNAMDIAVGMFTRTMMPWGEWMSHLPLPSNRRFFQACAFLSETIDDLIARRRSEQDGREDFLSILLKARDEADGNGMSDEQLRHEAITIFMAGHETTANAMTYAWYLLAQNPPGWETMRSEIARVLGDRDPTAADLPKLSFVRAVMSETMRLYPPVWVVGRQAIRDWHTRNWRVPQGSVVLMSQWVVHRDQRWWTRPTEFDPWRWLSETDQPRYAYFPFGGGVRGCIGEAFAWMEGMLVLITISRRWRLQTTPRTKLTLLPTITLRPRGPVRMKVLPA